MSDKFSISPTEIQRTDGTKAWTQSDFVVVEEPLEIKIIIGSSPDEKPLSITMRTPGNDVNLAVGFLFSEGIIKIGKNWIILPKGTTPTGMSSLQSYIPMFPWIW